MKSTDLTITCHWLGSARPYCLNWQEGATRCHVWASGPGDVEETVHRNTTTKETTWRGDPVTKHREGDLTAKKYEKVRAAMEALTPADFDAAPEDRREFIRADEAANKKEEARARDEELIHKLAERLGYDLVRREAA